MSDAVGTPRKLVLNGVTYDVMADANLNAKSKMAKEAIPTSGRPLTKMMKQNPNIESCDVAANTSEKEALEALATQIADITMSVTYADGSVYKAKGHINFDGWESESGKAALTLIPSTKDGWTPFLA